MGLGTYFFGDSLWRFESLAGGDLSDMITRLLFNTGFSILCYVFLSLSLYSIARRRGIRHAWLAWLPGIQVWILGCISDQYRYVVLDQQKNKRSLLLWLQIPEMILQVVTSLSLARSMADWLRVAVETFTGTIPGEREILFLMQDLLSRLNGILWLMFGALILKIILMIFYYITLFDVFTSCNPRHRTLFLVLSMVFPFLPPFFLFFLRDSDDGMPPRRPEPAPMPEPEPVPDPWDLGDEE